jgi:outer membrane protein OmpA-like peptidoglycan-associated protein
MESTAVNLGIGGQSGDGLLHLPNLGTNCSYPFSVSGFGAGIQVGVSKVSASGPVANMKRVGDLAGDYSATQGEVTVLAGAGGSRMQNRNNGVVMALNSQTQGIGLGFGGQGMTIRLADPPVNAPRSYVLEFGFNKTWVNQQSRTILDQVARAWKCRYANVWLFGHTDSVGKEDTNLELAAKRADAVRDYLVGTGIVPDRVRTVIRGEQPQLERTADNIRLRTNRAVVIVVQE